jgi:predicted small lipoprotein YifL
MKKIIPTLLLIFSMLALSSCGGSGINYKSTTQDVGERTTASYDSYKKNTKIMGPAL